MQKFPLRALVEGAMAVALGVVLHYIVVWHAPQGGSVTAGSMIPILLVAMRWGPAVGMLSGAVFGVAVGFIEPFIVHPVQYLLDYPIAFGVLGLAGFFRKSPLPAALVGISARFVSHLLSGVVFFASYAGGQNPWIYSAIYNASYLVPEMVISGVILFALRPYLHAGVLLRKN